MGCLSVAELTVAKYLFSRIFQSSKNRLTRTMCITAEKSPEHNAEKTKSHGSSRSKIPFMGSSKQVHSTEFII